MIILNGYWRVINIRNAVELALIVRDIFSKTYLKDAGILL